MAHNIMLCVILYRHLETVYAFYYPDETRFTFISFSQRIVLFVFDKQRREQEAFDERTLKYPRENRVACNTKIQTTLNKSKRRQYNNEYEYESIRPVNAHGRWQESTVLPAVRVPSKRFPSRSHCARDRVKSPTDNEIFVFTHTYIYI